MAQLRNLIEPLLDDDFHARSRALDYAIAGVTSEAVKHGASHGSAHLFERRRVYEEDIASRKDAFLAIVRRCLPQFRDRRAGEVLPELKELARERLESHFDEVQERLCDLARSFNIDVGDQLDLGKNRVIGAVERELELLVQAPASPMIEGAPRFDVGRLEQLRSIPNVKFDLSRLIRLYEELDVAFQTESFHAVSMLTRAILDHVPPIFGFSNFTDVANQYAGTKSFKEIACHLDESTRKVADSHLHTKIRQKEVLPTRTQVDAHQAVDVILGEVIRLLA